MGQIKVRNLEDWVIGVHRELASQSGQSLESYLRDMLEDAALRGQRQFADEREAALEQFAGKYGIVADSTEGIREDRNASL